MRSKPANFRTVLTLLGLMPLILKSGWLAPASDVRGSTWSITKGTMLGGVNCSTRASQNACDRPSRATYCGWRLCGLLPPLAALEDCSVEACDAEIIDRALSPNAGGLVLVCVCVCVCVFVCVCVRKQRQNRRQYRGNLNLFCLYFSNQQAVSYFCNVGVRFAT